MDGWEATRNRSGPGASRFLLRLPARLPALASRRARSGRRGSPIPCAGDVAVPLPQQDPRGVIGHDGRGDRPRHAHYVPLVAIAVGLLDVYQVKTHPRALVDGPAAVDLPLPDAALLRRIRRQEDESIRCQRSLSPLEYRGANGPEEFPLAANCPLTTKSDRGRDADPHAARPPRPPPQPATTAPPVNPVASRLRSAGSPGPSTAAGAAAAFPTPAHGYRQRQAAPRPRPELATDREAVSAPGFPDGRCHRGTAQARICG